MQMKVMAKRVAGGLLTLLIAAAVVAQEKPQKPKQPQRPVELNADSLRKPPSGPSFFIGPVEGSSGMFSVLLADGGPKTVAGTFTLQQIEVFQAVLEAAKAFALTDEKVGAATPITTRLMDQHEWSLFVDVSKVGNQSRFYITLSTLQGKLTAEAGELTRGSKKEPSALLLSILSQVQAAKARAKPAQ